jgi:hypothetical protein
MAFDHTRVLEALEKAVTSGNIGAFVPEDLEVQAHNTLWYDSQPTELTLMKLLPSTPATSIKHEFTQVTSFGEQYSSGFFGETSLPPETNIETERVITNIRLMGEIGPTFLLAALEKTQQVLGTTGAANIERKALRLNLLRKKNRNLYFADSTSIRQGNAGVRFRGLAQQIREGTDGTTGESPYNHAIDLEGQPLTAETLRDKVAEVITLFGYTSCLIMDPFVRADFEASFDSAQRLEMPISLKPYVIGQQIAGLQTQGGVVHFHTDNVLNPLWSFGQYRATLLTGAPTTLPVVTPTVNGVPANPGGVASKWDAGSAGEIYYMVTQVKDEIEGLAVRVPATPGTFLTVAAGQEVQLDIQPGDPTVDSFKIYRGTDADLNEATGTDAWFIEEIPNLGGGGVVTHYDLNLLRPNTSYAFALNIKSQSQTALSNGLAAEYYNVRERSADFLGQADDPMNTVSVAELGPSMGILALASILAEVDRPLMYAACSPQVRNPLQNFYFYNIGRA